MASSDDCCHKFITADELRSLLAIGMASVPPLSPNPPEGWDDSAAASGVSTGSELEHRAMSDEDCCL